MNAAYTLTNNSLTILKDGKVHSCDSSHPKWKDILDAIRSDDDVKAIGLIDIREAVVNYSEGNIRIEGNQAFYKNFQLHGVVVDRLLGFLQDDLPVTPLIKFIENLMSNPSNRAVNELYTFLEHKNLPITANGCFNAYKGLRNDYYSITSGKLNLVQGTVNDEGRILNTVGETIECPRYEVDDNKENHCSVGIHAGSLEYATSFAGGGKVVIVEINPADVVSIPSDCECQKLRTCKYKVIGEYEMPLNDTYNSDTEPETDPEWENGEVESQDEIDADDERDYDVDYSEGWEAGTADFINDVVKVTTFECNESTAFIEGYNDGYDTAQVDWDDGVNMGEEDYRSGVYRPNPGDMSESYVSGYKKSWQSAKDAAEKDNDNNGW